MKSPKQQSGLALLTAIIVVALVTLATVRLAETQQVNIRRTSNLLNQDQARLTIQGAEGWAKGVLARDAKKNNTDSLADEWATQLPPIEVAGGTIQGEVQDLQGRFNLNNLIKSGKPSPVDVDRFKRLLKALELEEDLAQAVVDWLDSDINPQIPDGAEDDTYQNLQPAYRAANRLMVDITELRLIKGIDGKAYRALSPHVAALPQRTTLNVNTAGVLVLRSLASQISESDAESLIDGRGKEGYKTVAEFLAQDALAGLVDGELKNEGLGVTSSYYLLLGEAQISDARLIMNAVLKRDGEFSSILHRAYGTYEQ